MIQGTDERRILPSRSPEVAVDAAAAAASSTGGREVGVVGVGKGLYRRLDGPFCHWEKP
jgi:hypothetical protein